MLTDAQQASFEENNELDLSFGVKGLSRFRANIFMQRGAVAGAFRTIPFKILTFDELGLPPVVPELCKKPRGLVLVTGPTGSGKSTTLAAIIDKINTDDHGHIMTIEDPIEFLHAHKNCIVNQREVGADTQSFKKALKSILRQDPDVVLVGEMRDLETIEAALTIAETGHSASARCTPTAASRRSTASSTSSPPTSSRRSARSSRSCSRASCRSRSCPSRRAAACWRSRSWCRTPAIRNLIREDKVHQIYSQMQVGQAKHGMQTVNQCLHSLVVKKQITMEQAIEYSSDPDELRNMIATGGTPTTPPGQRQAAR